jgi:hypothetical protein
MFDKLIDHIAGVLTALATAATAWLMWGANRREAAREGPIVECDIGPARHGLLLATFTVRNRMAESLIVNGARVRRPRGTKIGIQTVSDGKGGAIPVAPSSAQIEINRRTQPVGSIEQSPIASLIGKSNFPTDRATIEFYVLPPPAWSGGKLRIDLRISNRSLDVRERWIAVTRRISAETMTKIGDSAETTSRNS